MKLDKRSVTQETEEAEKQCIAFVYTMQCGCWKIVSAYLPIISVFSVLAIIQADVVYRDWDVEVIHFVLMLSKSSRESFLLRRLVMVKCILAGLMGGVVLPARGLPMIS